MLKRIFTLSSLVLLSYASFAAQEVPSVESMQTSLSKAIPEIKVESVKPTPVAGFYEVTSGPAIFYVSQDGQHFFYGDLFEIKGDQIANLTELTRQEFVKEALAKIDPKTLITFPATTDKVIGVVTIGTDVDCGYCRKLHEEVPALNAAGITVRYVAFPGHRLARLLMKNQRPSGAQKILSKQLMMYLRANLHRHYPKNVNIPWLSITRLFKV